ncbi:DUF3598 family protein [Thermosynechococcaceae cyanobacterium Okahandja]
MSQNWQNFRKNLGEWHGSFTPIAPDGSLGTPVPSILSLTDVAAGERVRFQLQRFANGLDQPATSDTVQEYTSISRQNVFFDTGAFSKGSLQVAPFAEFGAEYGFVVGDRRLRFVQLFNKAQQLQSMTLIREFRAGSAATERPPLTVEHLLGIWQGTAYTVYADWRSPTQTATTLKVWQEGTQLHQVLQWADQRVSSQATIDGHRLWFKDMVMLLLPDGAASLTPLEVSFRQPFFVEVSWLWSDDARQRLIRHYGDRGEWVSATLVVETRLSTH